MSKCISVLLLDSENVSQPGMENYFILQQRSFSSIVSVISHPFQFFFSMICVFFRKYKHMLHFVIETQLYYMRVTNWNYCKGKQITKMVSCNRIVSQMEKNRGKNLWRSIFRTPSEAFPLL